MERPVTDEQERAYWMLSDAVWNSIRAELKELPGLAQDDLYGQIMDTIGDMIGDAYDQLNR